MSLRNKNLGKYKKIVKCRATICKENYKHKYRMGLLNHESYLPNAKLKVNKNSFLKLI